MFIVFRLQRSVTQLRETEESYNISAEHDVEKARILKLLRHSRKGQNS